ncbi:MULTISPECIES: transposase [Streptomyces]|uniref:Transposase n=1 Tax=Streptomyces ehimensis TaxID=68195 RepID=A0ABV9BVY1_9ACTN
MAGYGITRLVWVLPELPVEMIDQLRSGRVMRLPKPPRVYAPWGGRPPQHGAKFQFIRPETWPEPAVTTVTDTIELRQGPGTGMGRGSPETDPPL